MPNNNNMIRINGLVENLLHRLSEEIKGDIRKHVQFADRQAKALAMQAAWIAESTVNGELDDEERDWFLSNLGQLTANFASTVANLTILTIEKAWNTIVRELWNAINGAINATLPIPKLPE